MARELFIGLMSGTSLDGVDAVLVDFAPSRPALLAHAHYAFAADLRHELLMLNSPGWDDLHRAAVAAQHLVRAYAAAVEDVLRHGDIERQEVRAVGAPGQTVRHRPDAGYTLQVNAPALLAELVGIDVVADLRSRDLAAGGHGAPLVPALHAALFIGESARAIVNIGGIANVTGLPARSVPGTVIGFDCGPGNILIDGWMLRHRGEPIDRDGLWASGGHTSVGLLDALLADPYFALPPPKSTGRELFNLDWVDKHIAGRAMAPRDVQTTLTRLTATTIARAIAAYVPRASEVFLCGGGAFNGALVQMITQECAPRSVATTTELGVAPDHVEAIALAWLARSHVQRTPGNLPAVTGARGPRVLGCLYPA
jgi:anhydro-N-acetylmuramic acid kinase